MTLDDPGSPCVMAASAPTVASRVKKMPGLMMSSRYSCGESSGNYSTQL